MLYDNRSPSIMICLKKVMEMWNEKLILFFLTCI